MGYFPFHSLLQVKRVVFYSAHSWQYARLSTQYRLLHPLCGVQWVILHDIFIMLGKLSHIRNPFSSAVENLSFKWHNRTWTVYHSHVIITLFISLTFRGDGRDWQMIWYILINRVDDIQEILSESMLLLALIHIWFRVIHNYQNIYKKCTKEFNFLRPHPSTQKV